jgi:glycosyltransferase involved in cell wall biosynthesis
MKKRIMILGKIPPPYMGPSIATQIILDSSLKDRFELLHIDTRVNTSLNTMGKFSVGKIIKSFEIWFKMFATIISKRPALVIIPISQSTAGYLKDLVFILIAKITFRKTLIHLRGSNFRNWLNSTSALTQSLVRSTLWLNNGVIVLGNNLKYLFSGIFSEKNIYVCPNGGDYIIPVSERTDSEVRILYLANLQPSKGIEDVLNAFVKLKTKISTGYSLVVVGSWRSGVVEDNCKRIVSTNNLPVTFLPSANGIDKFQHLSNADVFIFTPREPEGHPWVIVEAMAAGLPIISTDQGAIIESVKDGINGYIVPSGDPDSIADRLLRLINDPELRKTMSVESKKAYQNGFTEERMVSNLTTIFEKVIN